MSSAGSSSTPLELVVPVCLAGLVAVGASMATVASTPASPSPVAPLLLLALAIVAAHFPVPAGLAMFSLSSVFVLAGAVLYGAATAALLAALAVACTYTTIDRSKPLVRKAFNVSQAALAGGAAGLAAAAFGGSDDVLSSAIAGAASLVAVSVLLVGVALAHAYERPLLAVLIESARGFALPFILAISVVPIFVLAWESSKVVATMGVVPLVAVGLYLRTLALTKKTLELELALTDPLTGLGNRRHFDERLRTELDRADAGTRPMSLVLIDLDGFKEVNDRFGHGTGDALLCAVAASLRQGGEAFCFGGDEFALLLPDRTEHDAGEVVRAVRERLAAVVTPDGAPVQAGFGVATYPDFGAPRDELVRSADRALYREKRGVVGVR